MAKDEIIRRENGQMSTAISPESVRIEEEREDEEEEKKRTSCEESGLYREREFKQPMKEVYRQ